MRKAPSQSLAAGLERAHRAARGDIVRSNDLSRRDRELLSKRGWLVEVIRGWYLLSRPEAKTGDTVRWHSSYWSFISAYLADRFAERYCLSAEHSLDLWSGRMSTPSQLTVISATGGSSRIELPSGNSIMTYPHPASLPETAAVIAGVRVMPLGLTLVRATPTLFRLDPTAAEIALRRAGREELSRTLLTHWNAAAAARLIGAMHHLGLSEIANGLQKDLEAAGVAAPTPTNPFEVPPALPSGARLDSPHAGRVDALWRRLRPVVFAARPALPRPASSPEVYLREVQEIYSHDAYNSLSIEGYRVTPELIQRVAQGTWNPDNPADRQHADALAARGYYDAFLAVKESVRRVLNGANSGDVFAEALQAWYRALFGPSVQAGILEPWQLAGYRDRAVYITGSSHVPPPRDAVAACVDVLATRLREEKDAWVRAVLGHFVFVFIHPYSDGNGRLGRFLMNLQLASGGLPWTVVRLARRVDYMRALERASAGGDITAFNQFLIEEMVASAEYSDRRHEEPNDTPPAVD